jgi:hypothetical protein
LIEIEVLGKNRAPMASSVVAGSSNIGIFYDCFLDIFKDEEWNKMKSGMTPTSYTQDTEKPLCWSAQWMI